ncbi:uncharacterized protein MELLADRAFT_90101 [Melampsora larici-populina 98AG31]|uniref:Uncharacterized protein n=1 Tax=Melampsora larici-populina (strain 98AG31 / pathotype 3-4-7) TaxID=747676 RepID=F4RVN7_MELLP|nr:uncharacterized protein MELLADRAFT_90101 [Melampsora larici-populina 98AG31]EGG03390.1 hypothetical protein MELLADRAFT_90101 [Melampsora larici-populina 98AG31]
MQVEEMDTYEDESGTGTHKLNKSVLSPRNDDDHSQASNDQFHLRTHQIEDDDFDVSNEDVRRLLDDDPDLLEVKSVETSTKKNKSIQKAYSTTSLSSTSTRKAHKPGADTQVVRLLEGQESKINSSISKIEEVVLASERKDNHIGEALKDLVQALKPKKDPRSLLSEEEQVDLARLDMKNQHLKIEAAEIEVKRAKQSMNLEFAAARGKFIAQLMKDNGWTVEQAKAVADEVFVAPDN